MTEQKEMYEEPTEGLMPAGVKRLWELVEENKALRQRVEELERQSADSDTLRRRVEELEAQNTNYRMEKALHEYGSETPTSAPPREAEARAQPDPPSTGKRIAQIVGNIGFYLGLLGLIVGAVLIRSAQSGAPVSIAGYCGMVVLSGSMQDVYPKDSFIITHHEDPSTLQVGDDITFMASADTCVTHRIIEIKRQQDGTLAFRTKGVNNQSPDSGEVAAVNVVGKVIYHNLTLGRTANWVSANWPLVVFLLAVWATLSWFLSHLLNPKEAEGGKRAKKRANASGKLPDAKV